MTTTDKQRTHKYNATKTEVGGTTFDSKLEANVYTILKGLGFKPVLQSEYLLQESFKDINKTIRPITYVADFVITHEGNTYIMDAKGLLLPEAKLKYKLMLYKGQRVLYIKSLKSAAAVGEMIKKGLSSKEIEDILNAETKQRVKDKKAKKLLSSKSK